MGGFHPSNKPWLCKTVVALGRKQVKSQGPWLGCIVVLDATIGAEWRYTLEGLALLNRPEDPPLRRAESE